MIFSAKTQANPESSVGLMSMGGKGPEVLVTLTTDFGKVLDGMHRTKIRGHMHLATGLNIASVSNQYRPLSFYDSERYSLTNAIIFTSLRSSIDKTRVKGNAS